MLNNQYLGGQATLSNSAAGEQTSSTKKPRSGSKRGFASMSADKQREIASKGGRAAHAKGTAHEFSPEEARAAGRQGGKASSRGRAKRVNR